jgi:protein gp37
MGESKIDYLTHVWNPYTQNCTPVSEGCKNCYAREMQDRFAGGFVGDPRWRKTALKLLSEIPSPAIIGVNFLSDTWHENAAFEWIETIHKMAEQRPADIFIYTTKRAERLAKASVYLSWPRNLWVGVSIELPKHLNRLDWLRQAPAAHRWVSFEPLLADLGAVDLSDIDWVVTGAESGKQRRPFDTQWAANIGRQADWYGIPWFHKQGSHLYPGHDITINGREQRDLPPEFIWTTQPKQERLL